MLLCYRFNNSVRRFCVYIFSANYINSTQCSMVSDMSTAATCRLQDKHVYDRVTYSNSFVRLMVRSFTAVNSSAWFHARFQPLLGGIPSVNGRRVCLLTNGQRCSNGGRWQANNPCVASCSKNGEVDIICRGWRVLLLTNRQVMRVSPRRVSGLQTTVVI